METIINANGFLSRLKKEDGTQWIKNKKSKEFLDIMFRVNRKRICSCPNNEGNIELFITNVQQIPLIARSYSKSVWWWSQRTRYGGIDEEEMLKNLSMLRIYGDIKKNVNHGCGKISLSDDFDYDSNDQVSIEAHGTDEMNIWSAKHASLAVDKRGFARKCCLVSSLKYSSSQWKEFIDNACYY